MARPILYIGDQNPVITATLYDGTGAAIDLNPATFTLKFAARLQFDTTNLFGPSAATIVQTGTGGSAVNKGAVSYTLGSSDLASAVAGIYTAQWVVYDANLKPMHVDASEFEIRMAL